MQPVDCFESNKELHVEMLSRMQAVEDGGAQGGYVKEFTRHSSDVLLNLNELRRRHILTDATLVVGAASLRAHCVVLIACSGFFYTLFSRHKFRAGDSTVSLLLPDTLDVSSVSLLLDFMYTSHLPLSPCTAPGVLAAATYLQMEHVVDACRVFMLNSERTSAGLPHVELDLSTSAISLAPNGEAIPNAPLSGRLPLSISTSHPAGGATAQACRELGRLPGESWVSLEQETVLNHKLGSEQVKLEAEASSLGSPPPFPESPSRSSCQPTSPLESSSCSQATHTLTKSIPVPMTWNWKKYKLIVLNPLSATTVKEEEQGEREGLHCSRTLSDSDRLASTPKPPLEVWPVKEPCDGDGCLERSGEGHCGVSHLGLPQGHCYVMLAGTRERKSPLSSPGPQDSTEPEAAHQIRQPCRSSDSLDNHPIKMEIFNALPKSVSTGDKPFRCGICGAQFNRPANLKTHSRIHSGEKPYHCDTCGARFVQVAHLRAHVLIHTGEKPYPCHTCGTRFRHLQTLKSHLRIHTGEKPYSCEKCELHFRHKSQLRLHLRQKHGAVTNTKTRYQVLADPYRPVLLSC